MERSTWYFHFYKILEDVNSAVGRWLPGVGRAEGGIPMGQEGTVQGWAHSFPRRSDGGTGVPMSQFTKLLT